MFWYAETGRIQLTISSVLSLFPVGVVWTQTAGILYMPMKTHKKIQSHSYLNADSFQESNVTLCQSAHRDEHCSGARSACPLEAPECAMTPHSRTVARETDRAAQSQDGDRRRMKFDEGNIWKLIEWMKLHFYHDRTHVQCFDSQLNMLRFVWIILWITNSVFKVLPVSVLA